MTLVINVLHKDFSLLAADRQANANGPTTITAGRLTINFPNGGMITGLFPKVITTANCTAAVGSAGTIAEHTYLAPFKAATSAEVGIGAVRDAAYGFFNFTERERFLDGEGQMINSSITSFFDAEKDSFWSFVICYTRFMFSQDVYARKANATAQVLSVGSGHDTLAKKIDGEEIERFTASIAESWSEPELAQWLERCFQNVSAENKSVGDTYDALIATRADPLFRSLVRDP
jgi:hypothetical protein